jgi:hypothetical protein
MPTVLVSVEASWFFLEGWWREATQLLAELKLGVEPIAHIVQWSSSLEGQFLEPAFTSGEIPWHLLPESSTEIHPKIKRPKG